MKLEKFRIKNYKSIIDSGDCYLETDMTIFAGKNESGKSSILEALYDFNIDKTIDKSSISLGKNEKDFEITLTLTASSDEVKKLLSKNGENKEYLNDLKFTISKKLNNKYVFSESISELFSFNAYSIDDISRNLMNKLREEYLKIHVMHMEIGRSSSLPSIFDFTTNDILGLKEDTIKYINALKNNQVVIVENNQVFKSYIDRLHHFLGKVLNSEKIFDLELNKFRNFLNFLPNFILFKSFEDNIPKQIPIADIHKSEFIKSLERISNFNIDLFNSKNNREKSKHKEEININFNSEYSTYWSQDNTSLKIDWDNETIDFYIKEEDELYTIDQRSQGKQWHLSFYLKTAARSVEKTDIFLIDEPGLFLHPSAQRDIYKRLMATSLGEHVQVIFSTHSPYLIRYDELYRVRMVEKTNISIGTQISNKVHARADKETLTPILTAIGLELSQGIHSVDKMNNIIVEGPADTIYLKAFAKLIDNIDMNFIFGGGSGKMGYVGTILNGWGCNVIYLADNDQGRKDALTNLPKTWWVKKELILSITDVQGGAVEDVFSIEEFKNYILCDQSVEILTTVSDFIKDQGKAGNKFDKVLAARLFLSKLEKGEVTLSTQTIDSIKVLFGKFRESFAELAKSNI